MSKFKAFAKSILIPLILGSIVGVLISKSIDYNTLNKPAFAPPSWLFPVAWTCFYILMGVSYGILETNLQNDDAVNVIYYAQLIANLLWPIAFFVLKWRLFAFVWIILLAMLVLGMIIIFMRRNKWAGILQIPYFLWVIFATYLNYFAYVLNK